MIILIGVAGAGKSLQGRLFADELGYKWISMGDIFRAQQTEQRQKELLTGRLLDDSEAIELIDKTLKTLSKDKDAVMEGFPRTMPQAQWIIDQISDKKIDLKAVFNLVVSKDIVRKRLIARGRSDDNEEIIDKRFEEYETKTVPIIDFFKQQGVNVYDIDADQSPESVHDAMMSYI